MKISVKILFMICLGLGISMQASDQPQYFTADDFPEMEVPAATEVPYYQREFNEPPVGLTAEDLGDTTADFMSTERFGNEPEVGMEMNVPGEGMVFDEPDPFSISVATLGEQVGEAQGGLQRSFQNLEIQNDELSDAIEALSQESDPVKISEMVRRALGYIPASEMGEELTGQLTDLGTLAQGLTAAVLAKQVFDATWKGKMARVYEQMRSVLAKSPTPKAAWTKISGIFTKDYGVTTKAKNALDMLAKTSMVQKTSSFFSSYVGSPVGKIWNKTLGGLQKGWSGAVGYAGKFWAGAKGYVPGWERIKGGATGVGSTIQVNAKAAAARLKNASPGEIKVGIAIAGAVVAAGVGTYAYRRYKAKPEQITVDQPGEQQPGFFARKRAALWRGARRLQDVAGRVKGAVWRSNPSNIEVSSQPIGKVSGVQDVEQQRERLMGKYGKQGFTLTPISQENKQ